MAERSKGISRLSLRHLALIAAIEDTGSLKQASDKIGMSQPRATKALQEAEEMTGHLLFHRFNRGLKPTVAGDMALRHAKNVLAQMRSMEREFRGLSTAAGVRLRVGTIMGAVPYVTEILQRYLQTYPQSAVELKEGTSAELLRALDREALDVVVGRHRFGEAPENYCATPFQNEVLRVVTSPNNPLAGRSRVTLEDLSASRWIVYTESMPMRLSLETEYRLAGLPFPLALIETQSALTTISVMRGDPHAVALLSGDVAAFFANASLVVPLAVHLRTNSDPYEAIVLAGRDQTENVRDFLSELISGTRSD